MSALCVCGHVVNEVDGKEAPRSPCPKCGSTSRRHDESLVDGVVVGTMVQTKGFQGGKSKRKGKRFESKDGDSLSTQLGRFVKLEQSVDFETKRYRKRIVDPKTGAVLRDVDEPLTEHVGRGSAKKNDA